MLNLFADRYQTQHELGHGAFGVVFLAHDTRLRDRPVALKVLHPALNADPATIRLFDNEAGALASLEHDNIVTVYDAGVFEGRRYIAMAYVPGPSLAQVVAKQGAQPSQRVAGWLQQAASALGYAHEQGMLHRDIKSANLLLDEKRNRIVVTDFGLAKAAEMSGGSMSIDSHTLTGTAAYRAPEVAKSGHSRASDLYGLGVVAYELLVGRLPFQADDPLSVMMLHATEPVPPLPETTPPWLADLNMQLLAKDPAKRPASAEEVGERVASCKLQVAGRGAPSRSPTHDAGAPPQAPDPGRGERFPEEPESKVGLTVQKSPDQGTDAEGITRPPPAHKNTRRWAIIITLFLLLLGIVGCIWLVSALWSGPTPETPVPPAATATTVPTPEPGQSPTAVIDAPNRVIVGEEFTLDGGKSVSDSTIVDYIWDFGDGTGAKGFRFKHTYIREGEYTVTLTVTDKNGLSSSSRMRITAVELQPPTSVIQAPQQASVGQLITFNGTDSAGSKSIVNYVWNFGDRNSASGTVVEHVYNKPGVYRVTLTVTDNTGLTDESRVDIVINEQGQTSPMTVLGGPSQAVVGQDATFDASQSTPGSSSIANYAWDFGNGETTEGKNKVNVTTQYAAAGTYAVVLTVTDENGLSSTVNAQIEVQASLEDTTWSQIPALPEANITAEFSRGKVSGFAGCNDYSGSYTTDTPEATSGALTIQDLTASRKLCEDNIMTRENQYLTAFESVTAFTITGDTLTLASPGGALTYEASREQSTSFTSSPTTADIPTSTSTPVSPTDTPIPPIPTPALGSGSTMISEKDGMELVYVPAGEFLMGSPDGEGYIDERPQHPVYLDEYWVDRTEVTVDQYRQCVENGDCQKPDEDGYCTYDEFLLGEHPVNCVNWHDAQAYCKWAGRRLPTEAEWEKAARGIDSTAYPWGNIFDGGKLNYCDTNCSDDLKDDRYDDGYAHTSPVGRYFSGASSSGALDMAGNVWEWVTDWYDSDYYPQSPEWNPIGPESGDSRVLRGGSWGSTQSSIRSTDRYFSPPDFRGVNVGFRCAVSPAG